MESWTFQPINSQLIAIKLKRKQISPESIWISLQSSEPPNLALPSIRAHEGVYTCVHVHARTPTSRLYSKLRESTESPQASSCLLALPLVREVGRLAAACPGAQEPTGPAPGPKPPAQWWVMDTEGPFFVPSCWAAKFRLRVEIRIRFCPVSYWKMLPWFFTL